MWMKHFVNEELPLKIFCEMEHTLLVLKEYANNMKTLCILKLQDHMIFPKKYWMCVEIIYVESS